MSDCPWPCARCSLGLLTPLTADSSSLWQGCGYWALVEHLLLSLLKSLSAPLEDIPALATMILHTFLLLHLPLTLLAWRFSCNSSNICDPEMIPHIQCPSWSTQEYPQWGSTPGLTPAWGRSLSPLTTTSDPMWGLLLRTCCAWYATK